MIIEVSSGKAGFKNYLEHGQKQGREFHRDELDQRIPLAGNLDAWALACEDATAKGSQYYHFTMSFVEDYVSDEMLQKAVDEFKEHVFAAWPKEERDRVPFYAEAHRPKIKTYTHKETGELIERKTHIHIGIGCNDLLTGKHVQLTGYLANEASGNLKYLDAFQEYFNARNGFASPKTSPRITPENAIDILARYTGQRPDELGTFNERKASLETQIQKAVIDQGVTTWEGFEKMLGQFGAVSKVRAGKPNESFAITPPGSKRRMRLEGVFFQREFIQRATQEKVSIISERARRAYTEQMAPVIEPAYLAETLDEWRRVKAREIRYLHTSSDFYKNTYLPADAAQREQLLDKLERENHGIQSAPDNRERQAAAPGVGLPKLPVRDLDAVQRRSEMLLRRDHDLDVRADDADEPAGLGLRQADGGEDRSRAGELKQPSSVLARVQREARERYERAAAKEKFAEIRRNIDGAQLLARLSHSHGLQHEIYTVGAAADGSTRIGCGSRALSANDFLTQELGLPWREAAPILREVYELQIGKRSISARGQQDGTESRRLWKRFQEASKDQAAITERLATFDVQTKVGRTELVAQLRREQARALASAGREQRKAVRAVEALRAATLKAEYREARKAARRLIRPPQKEAWRDFLQVQAQAGDRAALRALRRLDDSARESGGLTISGAGLAAEDDRKRRLLADSELLKALSARVERNGDVTFSNKDGRAVLREQGQSLQVLDPGSDEAIITGLILAQQMYGSTLTLTGPAEFQARVVALAVERGMPVNFKDQELEVLRRQLQAEKFKPAPRREQAQKAQEAVVDVAEEVRQPGPVVPQEQAPPVPQIEQPRRVEKDAATEEARRSELEPVDTGNAALEAFLEENKGLPRLSPERALHGTVKASCGQFAVLHTGQGKHGLYEFPPEQGVPAVGQSLDQTRRADGRGNRPRMR